MLSRAELIVLLQKATKAEDAVHEEFCLSTDRCECGDVIDRMAAAIDLLERGEPLGP